MLNRRKLIYTLKNLKPNHILKNKKITNISEGGSQKIIENMLNIDLTNLYFMENKVIENNYLEICRCGYTGEDGFELYLNDSLGNEIYEYLMV